MLCFQVMEEKVRGRPLSPTVREGLPIEVYKNVACVRIGLLSSPTYIPLSDEHQRFLKALPPSTFRGSVPPIGRLDVKDIKGRRKLVSEEADTGEALVLVSCQPGVELNGSGENLQEITYTAASYTEDYSSKIHRIRKKYNQFPPLGVDIMAYGGRESEMLLMMVPGSSFKMFRGGDTDGSWSNMTVVWTGEQLRVYPRYRRTAAN